MSDWQPTDDDMQRGADILACLGDLTCDHAIDILAMVCRVVTDATPFEERATVKLGLAIKRHRMMLHAKKNADGAH